MNNTKSIKVGDILLSTWGYDACIADFYKVVGRTAASLKIVCLQNRNTGDWVAGTSEPIVNFPATCKVITARLKSYYDGSECVKVNGHIASLWNGKPVATYNHH